MKSIALGVAVPAILAAGLIAQGPPPERVAVPPIATALGTMLGVRDLPSRFELPDVMVMTGGQRVTTPAQWQRRREEMQ